MKSLKFYFIPLLFFFTQILSAQDIINLFEQTVGFAKLFTWGEEHENVGLRFAWKNEGDRWVPDGNGFVFLTEGIGLYDYSMSNTVDSDDETEKQWHIIKEIKETDLKIPASLFGDEKLIEWSIGMESKAIPVNIRLLESHDTCLRSIIPYIFCNNSDSVINNNRFEFLAINDSIGGNLIFRITNLNPENIDISINNSPYPASQIGWKSQLTALPGSESVKKNISAIRMDGNITVPPYSFTVVSFPNKIRKHYNNFIYDL